MNLVGLSFLLFMNNQYDKNVTANNVNSQFIFRFLWFNLFTCSNNSLLRHLIHLLRVNNILQKFAFKSVLSTNLKPVMDAFTNRRFGEYK